MIADDAFEELPEHEPAWAVLDRVTRYRKQLLAAGYSPVPVNGKRIHLSDWQNIRATPAIIDTWATTRADHLNTGVLCRDTPFVDIDVTVEEVAEEIEALLERRDRKQRRSHRPAAEARHSVSNGCAIQKDSDAISKT